MRQIKADPGLRKLPVLMLTTTDDPREIARCHALDCCNYIVKPVDCEKFSEAMRLRWFAMPCLAWRRRT